MLSFVNHLHAQHCPTYEFYRGEKVPCFEKVERYDYVIEALKANGHEVSFATSSANEVLAQVHSQRYLDFLSSAWSRWLALDTANASVQPFPSVWPIRSLRDDKEPDNFIAQLGLYSMDNGTPMVEGTWQAVKQGADCAASGASHLATTGQASFVCSRPPGHHAGPDFMGGYCFLNNAAIAAQTLRNHGAAKVAILDVDFHHGNGTQSIFYERSDVFFTSIHGSPTSEFPFYLGYADEIGQGAGKGFNLNLPLAAGASVETWFDAFNTATQAIQQFAPEALVISLGVDTFIKDPISKFALDTPDYFKMGHLIASLKLPTMFVLEGGYAVDAVGENVVNVLNGFESFVSSNA